MTYNQDTFLEMLTFKRPAFTPYEEAFIDKYIRPFSPSEDKFGNLWIDVGSKPRIIWSSHTDTVHHLGGLQELYVDKNTNIVRLKPHPISKKQRKKMGWTAGNYGDCLGADCTTGVYIMLTMIEAGVEGRYIFHRAEEEGALGSKDIVKNRPDLLADIDAAIAFDRRGVDEVITVQGSYRTASDDFAKSFAKFLGQGYEPSPLGSFTDTRSYAAIIPECTNIAVGYDHQHSAKETQDLTHLKWLVTKMSKFDGSGLDIKRTPAPQPVYHYTYGTGQPRRTPTTVRDLVWDHPAEVAQILINANVTFESLRDLIDTVELPKTTAQALVA